MLNYPSRRESTITCLFGLRFLAMLWTIIGHTFIFLQAYVVNGEGLKRAMADGLGNQWIANFTLSVDIFFTMSGCLCVFNFLRSTARKNERDGDSPEIYRVGYWLKFYAHRLIRLWPAYVFTIATVITLSSILPRRYKPIWPTLDPAPACLHFGWQNLMFVNSLYDDVCMSWTWYLGTEFIYYALSPPLLLLFKRDPRAGRVMCIAITAVSALANWRVMAANNFPPTPMLWQQPSIFSADYVRHHLVHYIKPWYRVGPYLIGMVLGSVLAEPEQGLMGSEQGLMGSEQGLIEPKQGLMEHEQGLTEPQQGLMGPEQGLTEPQQGLIEPQQGLTEPKQGLMEPQQGLIEPQQGLTEPKQGLMEHEQGLIEPQQGPMEPKQGLTEPKQGPMEPKQGLTEPKQGLMEPEQSLIEHQQGLIEPQTATTDEKTPSRGGYLACAMVILCAIYGHYPAIQGWEWPTYHLLYGSTFRTALSAAIAWLIYACQRHPTTFINRALSHWALLPLSTLSYSVYLIHLVPVFLLFFTETHGAVYEGVLPVLGTCVLALAGCYAYGLLCYLLVERPAMELERLVKRRAGREKAD